ncbi:hypothetical protein MRX96_042422 [Rhipicephalus microplus]
MYVVLAVHRWAEACRQKMATTDKPCEVESATAPFLPKFPFPTTKAEKFVTFNTYDDTRSGLNKYETVGR